MSTSFGPFWEPLRRLLKQNACGCFALRLTCTVLTQDSWGCMTQVWPFWLVTLCRHPSLSSAAAVCCTTRVNPYLHTLFPHSPTYVELHFHSLTMMIQATWPSCHPFLVCQKPTFDVWWQGILHIARRCFTLFHHRISQETWHVQGRKGVQGCLLSVGCINSY